MRQHLCILSHVHVISAMTPFSHVLMNMRTWKLLKYVKYILCILPIERQYKEKTDCLAKIAFQEK